MNIDELNDTQRTLLIPLWGRARAAREASPLLRDPLAAEVADRLDPGHRLRDSNMHRQSDAVHIVRARVMDDFIRDYLVEHPRATVVNLGAGLDTAFFRVDNGQLNWVDIDLPEVIELRRHLLPSADRVQTIARSFLDPSWLELLDACRDGLFFQAAGLFIYFDRQQVSGFVDRLAQSAPGGELVFDYQSKLSRLFGNRGLQAAGMGGARLRWGMNGSRGLEKWSLHATLAEAFPLFEHVDPADLGGGAVLRAARMMDRVKAIMVARLRFL